MQIDCRDRAVDDLLRSDYYKIPGFQRPYSWEKQHIDDFWDDIIANEERGDYFIGSMVMYQEDDKVAIVDGQQRITTIIVFLCALRDIMFDEGQDELGNALHSLYIEKLHRDTRKYFTLDPGSSHPYFHNFIMSTPKIARIQVEKSPEEKLLLEAYENLHGKISSSISSLKADPTIKDALKADKVKERLGNLREVVLAVKLVFIKLANREDAFTVFETLNSRGLDLTLSHLVKNHIAKFLDSANPRTDVVTQDWANIKTLFDGSPNAIDINTFIYHYWISRNDYVTQKKLFRELSRKVQNRAQANELLESLKTDALAYRFLNDPKFAGISFRGKEREFRGSIYAIDLFKARMPFPLLLSILRAERERKIKPSKASYAIAKIENYHFISTAITSQRSSGGTSMMYANLARRFDALDVANENGLLKELLIKLRRVPDYTEFELHFLELELTNANTKDKKLIKYILAKLYGHLVRGALDIDALTVEHLLPQSQATTPELKSVVGKIGNLILATEDLNGKLGTKPFSEKLNVLKADADLNLRDGFLDQANTSWGAEEIINRTKHLARIAYDQVWRI